MGTIHDLLTASDSFLSTVFPGKPMALKKCNAKQYLPKKAVFKEYLIWYRINISHYSYILPFAIVLLVH